MAFADPQSVTINAIAVSLPRTSSGVSTGAFTSADGNVTLSVSHQYNKRTRRAYRLQQKKVASDPYVAGASAEVFAAVTLVVDSPKNGFTNTEINYLIQALAAEMTESTGARALQLLGGES